MKSVIVDLTAVLIFLVVVLGGGYLYLDSQPKKVRTKANIELIKDSNGIPQPIKLSFEKAVKETIE